MVVTARRHLHAAFEWTLAHITDRSRQYLGSLPFASTSVRVAGTWRGPRSRLRARQQALNSVYVTEDCSDDVADEMGDLLGSRPGDIVCFGHTHKPWRRTVGGVHFVNAGSVGRPGDGDPRAWSVLLDVLEETVGVERACLVRRRGRGARNR